LKALKTPPFIFLLILVTFSSVRAVSYPPQVFFTYGPPDPFVNEIITFDASSSTPGLNGSVYTPIVEFRWNFSDGTPLVIESDSLTTHVYTEAGNYAVTLNVTDTIGRWNATSQTIEVRIPEFNFTVTPLPPESSSWSWYYIDYDNVQINGNLALDGNPVPDGLVALEVLNPNNLQVVLRTLKTGTAPVSGSPVNITHLFLCDMEGNPKNYTIKGAASTYVSVIVKNTEKEALSPVVVVLNLYQGLYPLSRSSFETSTLLPGTSFGGPILVYVPDWVSLGNVTLYVSVLSGDPHLGGYPYCQEKFLTFPVANPLDPPSGTPTSGTSPSPNTNGTYNSVFKIHSGAKSDGFVQGHYSIYVSAYYRSQQITNNTIIEVKLAGDVDGDGDVDSIDVFSHVALAYGSKVGDPNYNPDCDFDGDGDVDPVDVFSYVAPFYGKTA